MPHWLILILLSLFLVYNYIRGIILLIIFYKSAKQRQRKKSYKRVSRILYDSIETLIARRVISEEIVRLSNTDKDISEWGIRKNNELSSHDLGWIEHKEKEFKKEEFINSLPELEIIYETRNNSDSITNNGSSNLLANSSTYSDIQENE